MSSKVAIIGGGPAGLAAAEVLAGSGHEISVYDAMPTFARKFLLAGKSGLNITHSEPYADFVQRFGASSARLRPALDLFTPEQIRQWAADLGTTTFVGSSGRVFPHVMKASPLLRAWLARLAQTGVKLLPRHRFIGFDDHGLKFTTPEGEKLVKADVVLLALGGASWPRLGADGGFVEMLRQHGVAVAPLKPANCGFDLSWSENFKSRFAGEPVKSIVASSKDLVSQGEFVISQHGIEGSLIYAHAASLRDDLIETGQATLFLDLCPGRSKERLRQDLARQDRKASLSNRLRKGAGLDAVKIGLLRESVPGIGQFELPDLAEILKNMPLNLLRPRPIAEAISVAGGLEWEALSEDYQLKSMPGVFAAGEMIDWEAPTGGYLLTACMAMGRAAGQGMAHYLSGPRLD